MTPVLWLLSYVIVNLLVIVIGAPLLLGARPSRVGAGYVVLAVFAGALVVAAIALRDWRDARRIARLRRQG